MSEKETDIEKSWQMNNILPFVSIPCKHCGERSMLKDYHHSYNFGTFEYIITCPECQKEMLMEITLEKKKED